MNLRKDTDLPNVLAELGLTLAEQQIGSLFMFKGFAGRRYFYHILLILGRYYIVNV